MVLRQGEYDMSTHRHEKMTRTRKINAESTKSILLIDDETEILEVLGESLEVLGYTVWLAPDGDRAEALLRTEHIDLIISDIMLPGRNGVELLECFHAIKPEVPVIMMTGCGRINLAIDCFKRGAVDFLTKPISIGKLDEVIDKVLRTNLPKHKTLRGRIVPKVNGLRFVKVLGEGSMGVVYLVENDNVKTSARQYALKSFKSFDLSDAEIVNTLQRRFENEAKAAFSIHHPNVIKVFDFDEDEDGNPYILMEYFDGTPIDKVVREKSLDVETTCHLLEKVADALETIHQCGVCHRDVKPSNVLVDERFEVKIMDFGIARMEDSTLTSSKHILGSPPFMSPEMFLSAKVDHRSDIFSFGAFAYYLFTQRRPFDGDDLASLAHNIRYSAPIWPKKLGVDLPSELEMGLKTMLAKRPDKRYQTAGEIRELLSGFSRRPEQ